MVSSQEVVERTLYIALLHETLSRGLTINPDDYLEVKGNLKVPTKELYAKYESDLKEINDRLKDSAMGFTYIFGIGNNQERGPKILPRITMELKSYYPGGIGVEKEDLELQENGYYQAIDYDYETKDILIDIHLCSNTQDQMRILHDIMYRALPSRGYIRPYFNDYEEWKDGRLLSSGNLYLEVGNYYDHPDLNHGFLEKVYTYTVVDGLLYEKLTDLTCSPIKDISCLMQVGDTSEIEINVP